MFPKFEHHYPVTSFGNCSVDDSFAEWGMPDELAAFLAKFEGTTFGNGIYRVPCRSSVGHLMFLAGSVFPELKSRILIFAIDWLGRIFALDKGKVTSGQYQILRLDAGFMEAANIPVSLAELHEMEFVNYADDSLSKSFFDLWKSSSDADGLLLNQCVGYKVLPTLGGEDVIDNLEISDLDVYWTLCARVWLKIKHLPDGTRVGNVTIE